MDLSRAPNDRKLYLCKWYFRGKLLQTFLCKLKTKEFLWLTCCVPAGFIFLPFVWAINTIWFFSEAFRKPAYEEQNEIKKCKWDEYDGDSSIPPLVCCSQRDHHCYGIQQQVSNSIDQTLYDSRCDFFGNRFDCLDCCNYNVGGDIPIESCRLGWICWFDKFYHTVGSTVVVQL